MSRKGSDVGRSDPIAGKDMGRGCVCWCRTQPGARGIAAPPYTALRDGAVDIGPTNTPSGIRTIHHNQQPPSPEVSKERWDVVLGGVGWWEPLGKGGWLDGVGLGGFANLSDSMGLQF